MAQWLASGAHNSEVTRSKRVAGIYHSPSLQKLVVKMDAKRIKSGVNLLSSRWTQNVSKEWCETRSPSSWRRFKRNKSDVTRSIRVVSAFIIRSFIRTASLSLQQHFAGMAQRLARVAHNHEDTGSKPVAGIYHSQFIRTA